MSKFKKNLIRKLKNKLKSEELVLLPSSYQLLDKVLIIKLNRELFEKRKLICEKILELNNIAKTIFILGLIEGEFRKPKILYKFGDEVSEITHKENGIYYRFDPSELMFAKGNVDERVRIPKQVQENEVIVDMFSGLGYFSLGLGKLSKAKKIYSIEKNPISFKYLKENIKINHIHNIEAINGDCRKEVDKLVRRGVRADRVIMGYLPPPKEFLDWAFKIIKKGGILHYEDIIRVEKEKEDVRRVVENVSEVGEKFGFEIDLLLAKKVKSYGPKTEHWVFDIRVG